ncbi:MAG: DsrE/DsrF/DrsH-like family protein [Gammaproteobacteria bacterium]|nr:DsrE/DsrF/DrsH-like family protein [Gammaproteobacteria bacterium]
MSDPISTMKSATITPKQGKRGTVLLVSGALDKALLAFEVAAGFQAMGMEMSMWFVLYGANCLRKPQSLYSPAKWFSPLRGGIGRTTATDHPLQYLVKGLNPSGADHLPLSQLNFGGIGPWIIRKIMRRKGMAQLEALIFGARDLGVRFTICQICVDAMAFSLPDDLIVEAEVKGVSAYYREVMDADYNATL